MKLYERELFLYRIIDGRYKYKLPNEEYIYYSLTQDIKYKTSELYNDVIIEAQFEGLYSDESIIQFLMLIGFWSKEEESKYNELPKLMEAQRIEIFQKYNEPDKREKARKTLRYLETQMSQLLEKRHQFDWLTCYGVATQFKLTYYLENCTKFADGKLYDWQDVSLLSFLSCMNKDTIDDSKIREIARNEPWQSIWRTSNKDSTVFNRTPLELTEDQKKLILWTAFYDNIHENQDCPSKQIIDDDDALDGWLILQHQKQGKETKEDPIASKLTNPKIANANEIFILADNEEEAKKIDELNDANSKRIKRERVAVTMARGEVQEYEMPDNQLHLRTMATKAYSDFIKRNK